MSDITILQFPAACAEAKARDQERRNAEVFSDETAIKKVKLHYINDDIIIDFETSVHKFRLTILLQSKDQLDWRECAVISESLEFFMRGTITTKQDFKERCEEHLSRHGGIRGPVTFQNKTYCWINPVPAHNPFRSKEMIKHVSLRFVGQKDLQVSACTQESKIYNVTFHLNNDDHILYEEDSNALLEVFKALEVGETINESEFLHFLRTIREKFNFLVFVETNSGGYDCRVVASYIKNMEEIDSRLLNTQGRPTVQLESFEILEGSPYDGITFIGGILRTRSGYTIVRKGKTEDHTQVIVKIFDVTDEATAKSYSQELKVSLRLNRHENVVEVLEVFSIPKPAIVTKFIQGDNLYDYLRKNGRFNEQDGLKLALGIAQGIKHLHNNGIVHRDIKSPNILLDMTSSATVPVIVDFGLSRRYTGMHKNSGSAKQFFENVGEKFLGKPRTETSSEGTLLWVAPEIARNEWSKKSDIFSFGVVLWEIFAGDEPYKDGIYANNMELLRMIVGEKLRPNMRKIKHISEGIRLLIQKMWNEDPDQRPEIYEVIDRIQSKDPLESFKKADTNNDGSLTIDEFVSFLQEYAPEVTTQDATLIFMKVDTNSDRSISIEEFTTFWKLMNLIGFQRTYATYDSYNNLYHTVN